MSDLFKAVAAFAGMIVAIIGLVTTIGIVSPKPTTQPDAVPAGGPDRVQVSNVYNLPKDRGLQYLQQQGFGNVRSIKVCSNSVAVGQIREVLLDDGSSLADETVFVGPTGSKPVEVPLSTKLLVKVANGPCS